MFLSGELIVLVSSTIIEHIDTMRKAGLASLIFFYCDIWEDKKKDLRGLLTSLLVQLCHQSETYCDALNTFFLGYRQPSNDALAGCLKDLLRLPGLAPVYFIVDGLDEFPSSSAVPSPRHEVLSLIEELVHSGLPNLRLCVTSRPLTNIKDALDSLIFLSVSLHNEGGHERDIEDYIKSVIYEQRWKAELGQLAIDFLIEKADGM